MMTIAGGMIHCLLKAVIGKRRFAKMVEVTSITAAINLKFTILTMQYGIIARIDIIMLDHGSNMVLSSVLHLLKLVILRS